MRRLIVTLIVGAVPILAAAASLEVRVRDGSGAPVDEAVVWVIPEGKSVPPPSSEAVMDQKNRMFVPHVLAVQTGTSVRFPNSDQVRHHVYSFSPPKRFQLPLYEGSPADPVVFDKPGVVSLGCNIHDRMSAYIIVVDTPWFGLSASGTAVFQNLPAGAYSVHVWHEIHKELPTARLTLEGDEVRELVITVRGK